MAKLVNSKLRKGWLERQLKAAKKEVDSWPDWKKSELYIFEEEFGKGKG